MKIWNPSFELVSALLLGVSALATAWSGYQAVRWSGRQAEKYSLADEERAAANRASQRSMHEQSIDLNLFTSWLGAYVEGHQELAEFYRARFRPEFRPAFDAWLSTKPRVNPSAPPSPFALPEYRLSSQEEAARLIKASGISTKDANDSNEQGDSYQLLTVIFATVMLLAGIVPPMHSYRIRASVLFICVVMQMWGIAVLSRYPVE